MEDEFGFAECGPSPSRSYAGKIVDTLVRQHPHYLFHVRDLVENEGIDDWAAVGLEAAACAQ
ncbi:hypothetical protein [Chelativorans sp. Marseille-P2723]|uniref:hypothetical protein n=1 Tax=Chelativorans sp. Marseille-P2723 TaxID=2709133 RepID=UPI00157020B3|nr:hypothetical protein [Chelativorans sp. Marseille-P2723]